MSNSRKTLRCLIHSKMIQKIKRIFQALSPKLYTGDFAHSISSPAIWLITGFEVIQMKDLGPCIWVKYIPLTWNHERRQMPHMIKKHRWLTFKKEWNKIFYKNVNEYGIIQPYITRKPSLHQYSHFEDLLNIFRKVRRIPNRAQKFSQY